MAKIKSTLELVMEKTKDLSMDTNEREAFENKQWTEKARGWVSMLADNKYTVLDLQKDFIRESSKNIELPNILRKELLNKIDPDEDNSVFFKALSEVLGLDVAPLVNAIKDYRDLYDTKKQDSLERKISELKATGFYGTALVANVERDHKWLQESKNLKEQFRLKVFDAYSISS